MAVMRIIVEFYKCILFDIIAQKTISYGSNPYTLMDGIKFHTKYLCSDPSFCLRDFVKNSPVRFKQKQTFTKRSDPHPARCNFNHLRQVKRGFRRVISFTLLILPVYLQNHGTIGMP